MKRPLVRHLLALAVAAMGVINLWSALLSRPPERLLAMRRLVPTDVLDTSRTFTLLAGALLLVTASGLRRGKRRAFVGALLLSAVSVPVNLLKAFDLEEATVAAALLFLLGVSGQHFQVRSRELSFRALRSRALWLVLALAVYAVLGCWWIEARYGADTPGALQRVFDMVLFQKFGIGDPALDVPHHQRIVRWFLDSLPLLSITTLIGVALAALQPAAHRARHRGESGHVARLLREHGESTVSAFALAPDADYFFSANGRAVIAYRFESDTLLVIGDPIGPPEEIPPLLGTFATHCREHDWQFAFYQARPEHLPWYRRFGWRAVHIGEDPVLWTERFTLEGPGVGTVRRAVRKLERSGLEARMFVPGENPFDAAHDAEGLLDQLRAISTAWVHAHPGGERGFCMGRFEPAHLGDAWLAVAWTPATRRVEGFITWTPIWARRGWALDLMRRRDDAPTGTMEFLVAKSVEAARARGDAMLSLSLSALARVDQSGEPEAATAGPPDGAEAATALPPGAITDDRAREFLMEKLARFYDFKGLFRWKRKFAPAFEDRYLVYPDPLALPRIARALLKVQSPGGLLSYFRRDA
ncbi:MAG: DUF2156 domain-containing protein [Candidatus Eisenbacteria bacterium]|nr:DUF2156 domain-containing protein [Candidatus Eisenbacteria bacterium]